MTIFYVDKVNQLENSRFSDLTRFSADTEDPTFTWKNLKPMKLFFQQLYSLFAAEGQECPSLTSQISQQQLFRQEGIL